MSQMSSLGYSASATGSAPKAEAYAESLSGAAELTISQMSRLYSVSLRTLRFYEDRGLIKPRREGNARFYRAAERVRLEMILQGKKLGFTLTEINDLIGGKDADETPDFEQRLQPLRPHCREEARRMWDLTLALEELRDDLAETQRKISILEQTGRELMAIVDRSGEPEIDPLIRRHLAEIEGRMVMALVRPRSIARFME